MATTAQPQTPSPTSTQTTKNDETSDDSQRANLEHFLVSAITSGITNLGVVLEVLHLADYNLSRAIRILALVAVSPPSAPSIITHSGSLAPDQTSPSSASPGNASFPQQQQDPSFETFNPVGAVEASVGTFTASASAASQYSVAVVAVGPNSAGVAVGTSAGTTTSTAVPLSAVTSLPSNSNFQVVTEGASLAYEAEPNTAQTAGVNGGAGVKARQGAASVPRGVPARESSLMGARNGARDGHGSLANGTYVPAGQPGKAADVVNNGSFNNSNSVPASSQPQKGNAPEKLTPSSPTQSKVHEHMTLQDLFSHLKP
ncbi:hypothetical protein K490DRAFT_62443 [Saccharata proteae CBS 121410]|uniref:Uncharacterized protein n=1 Tax=Saccharata proteae CBS 121410 TaxID=1314787 RepID=A0A9P4LY08_9PEZI|nr:hypothetical protein K490DRAFT_62443 [Saccharata proteae CBS 121410]